MKKIISSVLAVLALLSLTAGISVNAAEIPYKDGLTSLAEGLENDPESGCFLAMAVRQYDPGYDLTGFGELIAAKDVPANTVTAMKYALTVSACGVTGSVYDSLDKEKIKAAESTSGLVFALHLINNGYDTGMTAKEGIERLLSKVLPSGGFPTVGTTPDVDMTSMAVQALAPYKNDEKIAAVIDAALAYLSSQQTETGAFRYFGSENSENCSQAIMALSSLGIDARYDERFIKNGVSVYDALLSYRLEDGRFEHVHGDGGNGAATAQAYCALVNNDRLAPFYVLNEAQVTKEFRQSGSGINTTVILVICICAAGAVICLVFALLKKKRPVDYIIVAAVTAALAIYVGVSGVKLGGEYFGSAEKIKATGSVTFSVDCSLVEDREMIPAQSVGIQDGDTAYSVLIRVCRQNGLTVVNSGSKLNPYISGIGDLYESAYGPTSGWGYKVNGRAPSVGSGAYVLKDGDTLEWLYVPDVSLLGD
ncbi:MAG: DUF4430 domain-containing protein [Clostridia bacterium]|nr:DUF4430 domain-containing protein [Clostridia bacterium]